jgi:Flp pilus assembly pilin Flp
MMDRLAAGFVAGLHVSANRLRGRFGAEDGQGTVEYAGLAMAIGVLLIAVGSFLGGKDHGIGSVVTSAIAPRRVRVCERALRGWWRARSCLQPHGARRGLWARPVTPA